MSRPSTSAPPSIARASRRSALIEELRKRKGVSETRDRHHAKMVREKPIVRETSAWSTIRRASSSAATWSRMCRRRTGSRRRHARRSRRQPTSRRKRRRDDEEPRVIHADAEVTILGPDRMSIRLFRKRGEPEPKASPANRLQFQEIAGANGGSGGPPFCIFSRFHARASGSRRRARPPRHSTR